jgi:multidrug transporter EmrE-like cation transporter
MPVRGATIVLLCLVSGCFQVVGTTVVKSVLKDQPVATLGDYVGLLTNYKVLLAMSCLFAAAMVIFKALSIGQLSVVTPVFTGINFVFTVAAGRYLFSESLGFPRISGLLLILTGVVVVALTSDN